LQGKPYEKFKNGESPFIWLHGIPGCGKSVLSSTIIEDLFQFCQSQPGNVVVYYYFDFSEPQKQVPELMVRSIITQLVRRCGITPQSLRTLFSASKDGRQPVSIDAYLECLRDFTKHFSHVYLVLDALDECRGRGELTDILSAMVRWEVDALQLLVTSRKERVIERSLEDLVEEGNVICLQSQIVDKDIQLYTHERLSNDKDLQKWCKDKELQNDIERALAEGSHGMYVVLLCCSYIG
jgi:NACHT domain